MGNNSDHNSALGGGQTLPAGPVARPDFARESRRGIPEVILAQGKTTPQVIAVAREFLARTGRALISRLDPAVSDDVLHALPEAVALRYPLARALRLTLPDYPLRSTGGHVGIITAGTSDIPIAEEARFMAEAMGCRVTCIFDVGVAGVHRLFAPLEALLAQDVAAVVVAAGMDGALPSLVAGLVPVPVIGLPTPVGYGMGGGGEAALLAMLQGCAPGLAVVNIGNGIGAGAFAALIANRVAEARRSSPQPPASLGQEHADAAPAEQSAH
jgi:NCAIR mutase (PurE)-related protein